MNLFEILLAAHQWKESTSKRPFLLMRPLPYGDWDCFPISTKNYNGDAFEVHELDPDFAATGLNGTSYIHDARVETVKASEFISKWGQLQGDLLKRFRDSSGI